MPVPLSQGGKGRVTRRNALEADVMGLWAATFRGGFKPSKALH